MPENIRMTARIRELFQSPWIFVLACGMNGEGANIVEEAGYGAFYMSEDNTSAHPWQGDRPSVGRTTPPQRLQQPLPAVVLGRELVPVPGGCSGEGQSW